MKIKTNAFPEYVKSVFSMTLCYFLTNINISNEDIIIEYIFYSIIYLMILLTGSKVIVGVTS